MFGIEAVSEPRDVHRKRPANSTIRVSLSDNRRDGSHRRCWHGVGKHPVGSVGLAVDSVGFDDGGGGDAPISMTGLRKDRDMLTFVSSAFWLLECGVRSRIYTLKVSAEIFGR